MKTGHKKHYLHTVYKRFKKDSNKEKSDVIQEMNFPFDIIIDIYIILNEKLY